MTQQRSCGEVRIVVRWQLVMIHNLIFLNFSNVTNKVAPFCPSVSLLLLRKLKPYLEFCRRVAFKCGVCGTGPGTGLK